jgi:hypothetical protein
MELKDVSTFLEQNADKDEVKTFVKGFYAPEKLAPILDSDEGLKILQPRLDKYHTKGLESWKEKNLNSIVEQEISKRYPAQTEEQKRIKTIEDELKQQKTKAKMEEQKNIAITKLNENKMPLVLSDLILGEDDETFNKKFSLLKTAWDKELDNRIKEEIKKNGRQVHKDQEKKFTSTEMNSIIREAAGIK